MALGDEKCVGTEGYTGSYGDPGTRGDEKCVGRYTDRGYHAYGDPGTRGDEKCVGMRCHADSFGDPGTRGDEKCVGPRWISLALEL